MGGEGGVPGEESGASLHLPRESQALRKRQPTPRSEFAPARNVTAARLVREAGTIIVGGEFTG